MSNFMPLRQLIADLINTLLLAILTGGRVSACMCVCVCMCLGGGRSVKGIEH